MQKYDVIIVGAGAAGMMCAAIAGQRGRRVLVLEQANKPGKKILMSGGGRCNFTNYHIQPQAYLSNNPHFCKSALSRYTQWDFIKLVEDYEIPYHEKTLGQLFCDHKSQDIVNMLLKECELANAQIQLKTAISSVKQTAENQFQLQTDRGEYLCESLVIASGGLSIPTMGSSPFGYRIAEQFGIKVWPTRAGLVPFTMNEIDKQKYSVLSGISVATEVSCQQTSFKENSLFTHRGMSGPAMLQISSYWREGDSVLINMLPEMDMLKLLLDAKKEQPKKVIKNILAEYFAKRMLEVFLDAAEAEQTMASFSHQKLQEIAKRFAGWEFKPNGTEGYRTAEVTLGGVDCNAVSSKTMEATTVPGLFFIGEVLDVTGWLGGYNFQWAWSSAWACGQAV